MIVLVGTVGVALVGLSMGEATVAAVQAVAPSGLEGFLRTWWPVMLCVGGGIVGYIRLQEQHKALHRAYRDSIAEQARKEDKLTETMEKVLQRIARIEGMLETTARERKA